MIVIDNIVLSKNPVQIGETIIIKITLHEEMAQWQDTKTKTWSNLLTKTWDQVKKKIF